MSTGKIKVELWPERSWFPGKRINRLNGLQPETVFVVEAEPAEMELLIAEYSRTPARFEQEAARSLYAALREYEESMLAEDVEYTMYGAKPPVPEFLKRNCEQVPPYGQN
jgi:hypothetical protein